MNKNVAQRHIRNEISRSSTPPPYHSDDESDLTTNSAEDVHQRTGYRLQAAIIASVIPLLLVLVTTVFVSFRFYTHHRAVNEQEARIAGTWVAQRIGQLPRGAWSETLRTLHEKTDLLFEIQNSDAVISPHSLLSQFSPSAMVRVSSGQTVMVVIADREYFFTALPVHEGSKWMLFAGAPTAPFGVRLWTVAGRLFWIGIVLIGVAAIFGFAFGETLHTYMRALGKRLETMSTLEKETLRPIDESRGASVHQTPLAHAISGLEQRFRGEFALYRDALDEIRIMDAQRSEFLGSVSLELSFPLEAITARAQVLLEGEFGSLSESQQEDMLIIKQAGQRLLDMVNEIRDLSSLTTDGIKFDSDPVELTVIAQEVVSTIRGQAQEKDLAISLEVEETPPLVRANRGRMWQVITNLVSNAVKFTDNGSVLVVLGKTETGDARIEVRDTGPGISTADREAIFDPFQQTGEKSKRRRGTGLGLALCKGLVDLHEGAIELESCIGEGSCFRVILPGLK